MQRMSYFLTICCLAVVFAAVTAMTVSLANLPYCPEEKKKALLIKVIVWSAGIVSNALVLWLLHLVFRGNVDLFGTLRLTAEKKLSYQSTEYIYGILLLWIPLAVTLGYSIRAIILSRLYEDKPFLPPETKRFKRLLMVSDLSFLGIITIASMAFCASGVQHLKLTEVCDSKVGRVSNGGYIELMNEGSLPCRLDGLYVSNTEENLQKYKLNDDVVGPGGIILVPLTDDVFTLSKSGGTVVILSDGGGRIVDKVVIDKLREGSYSYCRVGSTDQWSYMMPTPGKVNAASAAIIKKPEFSAAAGYYDDEFDLVLTAGEGTVIHYTTDGSTPTEDSPVYTKPIRVTDRSSEPNRWRSLQRVVYRWKDYTPDTKPVKKIFVVRAIATDSNGAVSEQSCASYFVGKKFDKDTAVVSLVADEEDLFGDDGIYMTGKRYDTWYLGGAKGDGPQPNFEIRGDERGTNIEFFGDGKRTTFVQRAGIRIQGGSSRWHPIKRFTVYSRKEYSGSSTFPIELFKGKATHSVVFRQGFENALSMYTVPDRDVAALPSMPVTVYVNGEFWYDTYMQEKYNNTYFRQTFGVEEVEFLKTGITDEIQYFLDTHDMSDQKSYEKFDKLVDIQSYIDYIAINVYLGNTDYSEYANTAMWRTTTKENDAYGDGRWRWALYDMDLQTAGCRRNYGLTNITDAQLDTYNIVCDWDPPVTQRKIYTKLKENAGFRQQFVLSMMDIMNTDFTEKRMSALLEQFGSDISFHEYFFRDRPDNMIEFTAKEFGLRNRTGELTVTTNDPAAGNIRVNTSIIDLSEGSWTGRYFYEYPVTLTAIPNPGYRFKGWSDGSKEASIELAINGGVTANAIFVKE